MNVSWCTSCAITVTSQNGYMVCSYFQSQQYYYFFFSPCLETNWYSWRITGKAGVLSWIQRLKIAIDSATGLWFLHTYPEGCIIHRDIKVNFFLEAGIIYFTFYSQSLFNCFFSYVHPIAHEHSYQCWLSSKTLGFWVIESYGHWSVLCEFRSERNLWLCWSRVQKKPPCKHFRRCLQLRSCSITTTFRAEGHKFGRQQTNASR